ncbi:MAG: DUF4290 domain-containing protein [Bacteroidales bacterium]|jgi:hypothetical protein|nr:DUF4290 domain-containing protein [Bacteroidales bacterium]
MYNTQRKPLVIPEYGRNVQNMIDLALTMDNKEKRTQFAYLIVEAMSRVNPNAKDTLDYRRKLWHHLYIMSDYKLDVVSPFDLPQKGNNNFKPKTLGYKSNTIKFRPYGNIIEQMIERVISMAEGEEKDTLIGMIAQQLKRAYLLWNVSSCDDETILRHFEHLSKGQLKLRDDFKLKSTGAILATQNKKKKNGKNNNLNNKQRNKNNKSINNRKNTNNR